MPKHATVAAALLLLTCSAAGAQSLADAARKEKERQDKARRRDGKPQEAKDGEDRDSNAEEFDRPDAPAEPKQSGKTGGLTWSRHPRTACR